MSGLARVDRTDLVSNKKVVILISRSATRADNAAVSKYEDAAEVQLSSRSGPQPLQSGAASRHPAGLQAETHGRIRGVARPSGVKHRLREGMSRHASTNCRYFDNAALRASSYASTARRYPGEPTHRQRDALSIGSGSPRAPAAPSPLASADSIQARSDAVRNTLSTAASRTRRGTGRAPP